MTRINPYPDFYNNADFKEGLRKLEAIQKGDGVVIQAGLGTMGSGMAAVSQRVVGKNGIVRATERNETLVHKAARDKNLKS